MNVLSPRNPGDPVTAKTPHDSRIVELEMQLMHLERNYEQLHVVCLGQHEEIESQRRRIEQLENLMRRLLDARASEPVENLGPFLEPAD